MTLDLNAVAREMDRLTAEVRRAREERRRWRAQAGAVLDRWGGDLEAVAQIARRGSDEFSSWMVAEPLEPLGSRLPAPPESPHAYTVVATDGSHIDTERHHHVRCYLVNIGRARITYGDRPHAVLEPATYFEFPRQTMGRAADTVLDSESDESDSVVVGGLVGPSRSVRECEELAGLAERAVADAPDRPAVGLLDATLVLWGLAQEAVTEEIKRRLLDERLFPAFERLLALAQDRAFAFGSYVSKPGSREFAHTLVLLADHGKRNDTPLFDGPPADLAGLVDRDIMEGLLEPGQRSALFTRHSRSTSSIERTRYGDQYRIVFFYLNTGREIARVETLYRLLCPDGTLRHDRIDLLHAVILDQCRRGGGYPIALVEADRQAVITGQDRQTFNHLLQRVIEAEGEVMEPSLKSATKVRPNA